MATKEQDDTGLGLDSFLGKKEDTQEAAQPAVEAESKPSAGDETAAPVEKPTQAEPPRPAGLDKDAKVAEAKPSSAPNWDSDDNPYVKRYKDTHRDWNRLNQEKLEAQRQAQEFQRQFEILNAKLDGTYDPEQYKAPPVDPSRYHQIGTLEGKAEASLASAVREHGEETVMRTLEEYAQIFGQDRALQERVLMSPDPIRGAMDAVKHHKFFTTYGNDPESIRKKLAAELQETELPKWREAETKRLMGELNKREPEPKGIGGIQGGSGAMDVKKDNAGRAKPLGAIFGQ